MWLKTAIQASNDFSIIWLNRQFQDLCQVLKMFFSPIPGSQLMVAETQHSRLSLA
jgi:hypothetical protein